MVSEVRYDYMRNASDGMRWTGLDRTGQYRKDRITELLG
jgi:hypothetical protein